MNFATKLSVKELAACLGVSRHYVYQMCACNFKMEWDSRSRCKATTEDDARHWLEATQFRLVKGYGVTKGLQPRRLNRA